MNNKSHIHEFQAHLIDKSKVIVSEVREMLEKFFFYDLLFYASFRLNGAIRDGEAIADQPIVLIEYIISLTLGLDIENLKLERATEEQAKDFYEKVLSLSMGSGMALNFEIEDKLIHQVRSHFLNVRGNNYDEHLFEYLHDLFSPFSEYFHSNIGFDIDYLIDSYQYLRVCYDEDNHFSPQAFVFSPKDKKQEIFFEYFAASIGDNKVFYDGKFGGFMGSESIVPRKSIIKYLDFYYVFNPLLILWNAKSIFESELKKDRDVWNKYAIHRADYLETKSIEYITSILPGSIGHKNVKYKVNGQEFESDGIIIYDSNIFLLEAKSGVLRDISKRGDPKWLENDMKELMLNGYSQAIRTKQYIDGASIPKFKLEDGSEITLSKPINETFLINTTGDFLGPISLYLDIQKTKGNIIEGSNFWSIFINDLRVIAEIIEFPSQFLLYLKRRYSLIEKPQIHFADELDIFMEYFRTGIYYEDGIISGERIDKFNMIQMDTTLTDAIDRFYWGEGEKPAMKIDGFWKNIILQIEQIGKHHSSEIGMFLLAIESRDFQSQLKDLILRMQSDGKVHQLALLYNKEKTILNFILTPSKKALERVKYINYTKLKLGQAALERGYNIYVTMSDKEQPQVIDFDIVLLSIFEKTPEFYKKLEYFNNQNPLTKSQEMHEGKPLYGKSPCPCGSGKKYKRCCGK